MRLVNEVIFNAVDISTTQTSAAFSLNQVYGFAALFVATGAPVGTIKIQMSCDAGSSTIGGSNAPTNWVTTSDTPIAVSAAGNFGFNINGAFYNWVRFVYTATSGTGTLSGSLNTKGV